MKQPIENLNHLRESFVGVRRLIVPVTNQKADMKNQRIMIGHVLPRKTEIIAVNIAVEGIVRPHGESGRVIDVILVHLLDEERATLLLPDEEENIPSRVHHRQRESEVLHAGDVINEEALLHRRENEERVHQSRLLHRRDEGDSLALHAQILLN